MLLQDRYSSLLGCRSCRRIGMAQERVLEILTSWDQEEGLYLKSPGSCGDDHWSDSN